MNKLPLIRQGQGFDYTVLNTIIKTINELIIDQPGYDTMMNDMATINNQYTSKIDSFIERYRDVVDNTPDLLELLKAYAALKEKCDGTPKISYEISSLALDFVKNPEKDNGYFDLLDTGLPNITPGFNIPKGKAIVCVDSTGDTSVFIQCTDIEFNKSAAYSWLCLDTIVGAEGPVGPQGKEGPQGIPGQDGEDGVIVNIRGNLNQVEGENIQLKLDSLINNPSINLQPDDAFIWEEESDPKIFVYTPNEQFSDPAYPGWTLIRSIRGPQGPKGEGTKLKIGFASSSASDALVTPSENVTLDNINEFFFLCIAIAEPNQPLVYNTKIRIRQGNQEFLPEVNWKYINESGAAVSYKEQDNDRKPISLKLIPVANTDTTEQQTLQLNLKDISDITAVKILEGGKLELTKEYQHIPTNVPGVDKPKIQKLIAEGTVSDFIKIDNTLTDEGTNAVQGKIVKKYIDDEANNIKIKMREKADLRDGKILASQLPGSVGKIIEGKADTPIRENTFKYFISNGIKYGEVPEPNSEGIKAPEQGTTFLDNNKEVQKNNGSYGFSGSVFIKISASITIGTTEGTAYDGKAGQDNANAIATLNTDISNIKDGTTTVPKATTSSSCTGNSATATTADKVSNGLTISLNGLAQNSFNGSSPVAFDITPSTIGALPVNGKAKNSDKADVAGSCSGNAATSTNATNHIKRTDNPHKVTAEQIGVYNKAYIDDMFSKIPKQVNADWNAVSGKAQILNKPTIPSKASDIGALPTDGKAKDSSSLDGKTESQLNVNSAKNYNTSNGTIKDAFDKINNKAIYEDTQEQYTDTRNEGFIFSQSWPQAPIFTHLYIPNLLDIFITDLYKGRSIPVVYMSGIQAKIGYFDIGPAQDPIAINIILKDSSGNQVNTRNYTAYLSRFYTLNHKNESLG